MAGEEEKTEWKVGVAYHGFELWVSRSVERIGRLSEKPKRSFMMGKGKQDTDNQELSSEFRAFINGVRDNASVYLWLALANLVNAKGAVDKKHDADVLRLFSRITEVLTLILSEFNPNKVTPDLLKFLKERISKIASPGAYYVASHSGTVAIGGEAKGFDDAVSSLNKLMDEITIEMRRYFQPPVGQIVG